jgi:hypothetical protein
VTGRVSRILLLAVAASTVVGSPADSAEAAAPHAAVVGVWETGEWERESGEKLDDIPERLEGERWQIARSGRCTRRSCTLNVVTEALVGPPRPIKFLIRSNPHNRYVGTLDFVSMCVEQNTRRVLEEHASDVTSTYHVRVRGTGPDRELALTAIWKGEPTPEGLAAGCEIRRARFTSHATRLPT